MVQHGTVDKGSFERIARAVRDIETNGTDNRRVQNGHRTQELYTTLNKRYFYAIQTATNKIKIIDGFDPTNAKCGNVSVNKLAIASVTATELTITADAFIYLLCVGVGDPLTSSTNTIAQYATEQSWETGKEKRLISRVKFTGVAITDFSNETIDTRIGIKGACD